MLDLLTWAHLLVAGLLVAGAALLVWSRLHDGPAWCIAGFSLAAAASMGTIRGWGGSIDPSVRLWVPIVAFGFGFSFLFAFTVLHGQRVLGPLRRVLLAVSFLPAIITLASLLHARDTLVGPNGGFTELGFVVFYVPEALAALIPLLYFGSKWLKSPPGALRWRYMWLVFPFAFWAMHDGLANGVFVHIAPERFPFLAGYPAYLIPLNIVRLVAVIALGLAAYLRSRSTDDRSARLLYGFVIVSIALSFVQYWDFALHFLLNGLMFLLILYGFARYRVLGIDQGIKWTVRKGTLPVAGLAGGLLAREVAQWAGLGRLAALAGIASVVLLVVIVAHLYRVADRVAARVLPGVTGSAGYLERRRLELYGIALQEALSRNGQDAAVLLPHQASHLAELRRGLGVSDREHEHLVATFQGDAAAPREGGSFLGRYAVEQKLGTGGHGTVYRAHDLEMDRMVVLKVLHEEDRARAMKEAKELAAVQHPNIATVFGVERIGDNVVLVMEYLAGGSLADRLREGALDEETFAVLGLELLDGLAAIHSAGAVHRDVKPANVLFDAMGRAKLADFGLADRPATEQTAVPGEVVGSAQYMAPEQARGRPAGPVSDVFAAGATLYEAYTGRPLRAILPGESAVELRLRAATATLPSGFPGPDPLQAWFAAALAPDPAMRFSEARAALLAFRDVVAPDRGRAAAPNASKDLARP